MYRSIHAHRPARHLPTLLLALLGVCLWGCGGAPSQSEKPQPDKTQPEKAQPEKTQSEKTQSETTQSEKETVEPPSSDPIELAKGKDVESDKGGPPKEGDPKEGDPKKASDPKDPAERPEAAGPGKAGEPVVGPAVADEIEPPPEPPKLPEYASERVVLLTLRGALLVELQLSIDGRPHTGAMERLTDYVLQTADEDGDERVTWDELTKNPLFASGQLGNAPITSEGERRNAIRMYDSDSDGTVDRSEVPRFITRNAGGSRPFSFRGSNYYRDINRRNSPIRLLLDADGDNRLTADEIDNAAIRLRSRDVDNDDLLIPSEFARPDQDQVGIFQQRRISVPDSAVYLGGNNKYSKVLYALEEQYAFGGDVTASAFEIAPELFAALDEDKDGVIDGNEIEAIETAKPQLTLRARFGGDEPTKFELVQLSEQLGDIGELVTRGANRVTVDLPGVELICFYRDNASGPDAEQRARAELMRYDGDNNNYVDEDEAPDQWFGLEDGFEIVDANDDDKVYVEEIADYFRNSRLAYFSQIQARAGDNNDVMFGVLDKNNDGRLDSREINGVAAQLAALDSDRNGVVSMDELPDAMALGVVRGDPQQMNTLFTIPIDQPEPAPDDVPRWFVQMDANGDGAISHTEFLGEPQQFAERDTNKNGFLEYSEIKPEQKKPPFEAPPAP